MSRKPKKKAKVKRKPVNPILGVTDGHLRAMIRGALRKCWRNSSRRVFIQNVRFPYSGPARFKFAVKCELCGRTMGQTEKAYDVKADGSRTKHKKLVYEVDHINGNPQFTDIERDLGKYAVSLLYGTMRILCRNCHKGHTKQQSTERMSHAKTTTE